MCSADIPTPVHSPQRIPLHLDNWQSLRCLLYWSTADTEMSLEENCVAGCAKEHHWLSFPASKTLSWCHGRRTPASASSSASSGSLELRNPSCVAPGLQPLTRQTTISSSALHVACRGAAPALRPRWDGLRPMDAEVEWADVLGGCRAACGHGAVAHKDVLGVPLQALSLRG